MIEMQDPDVRRLLPPGPWDDEPDLVEFEACGFECRIERSIPGFLLASVVVPVGHPWHGAGYDDVGRVEVHGGLSWCRGDSKSDGWLIGFDCGHASDMLPICALKGTAYRTVEYVRVEVTGLARQAAEAVEPHRRVG